MANRGADSVDNFVNRFVTARVHQFQHSRFVELFQTFIERFEDAIAVQVQPNQ